VRAVAVLCSLVVGLAQGGSVTARQIVGIWREHGYTYKARPGNWMSLLSIGKIKFGVTLTDPQPAHDMPTYVELQARFLPAGSVTRKEIEEFLHAKDIDGFKVFRYVNGVVELRLDYAPLRTEQDVTVQTDRFALACKEVNARFHVSSVEPCGYLPNGRAPVESDLLGAMSWFEIEVLQKKWHWSYEPHPLNEVVGLNILKGGSGLGMMNSTMTVNRIEVDYSVGMDQWPYVTLSAQVQIAPGGSVSEIVAKLSGSGPTPDVDKMIALVDQGIAWEWYGLPYYGEKFRCYSILRLFSVAKMTVGEFKQTVKDFAARVKELPRK
jgi:hypothetical protein